MFFLAISHLMSAMNPVLIQFPAERAVFLREENAKLYSTWTYFLGKSSIEMPFLVVVPLAMCLIYYWMMNLNYSNGSIVVLHIVISIL